MLARSKENIQTACKNAHTYDPSDHVCPPLHFLLVPLFEMVNERFEGIYGLV
jgi:hypothetical protein